jgi:hypothetical protein
LPAHHRTGSVVKDSSQLSPIAIAGGLTRASVVSYACLATCASTYFETTFEEYDVS